MLFPARAAEFVNLAFKDAQIEMQLSIFLALISGSAHAANDAATNSSRKASTKLRYNLSDRSGLSLHRKRDW